MSRNCTPEYHKGFAGIVTFDETKETGVLLPGFIDPYPYNILGVLFEENWLMIGKYTGHDSSLYDGMSWNAPFDVKQFGFIYRMLNKFGIGEIMKSDPTLLNLIESYVYELIEYHDLDTNFDQKKGRSLVFTPMTEKNAARTALIQQMDHYSAIGEPLPVEVEVGTPPNTLKLDFSSIYDILLEKAGCPGDLSHRLWRMTKGSKQA